MKCVYKRSKTFVDSTHRIRISSVKASYEYFPIEVTLYKVTHRFDDFSRINFSSRLSTTRILHSSRNINESQISRS